MVSASQADQLYGGAIFRPQSGGAGNAEAFGNENFFEVDLPRIAQKKITSMSGIRDPAESFYLTIIWIANGLVGLMLASAILAAPEVSIIIAAYVGIGLLFMWISWKLMMAFIQGHCIEVGPHQYPQVYAVIKQASDFLDVPVPNVFIMQGHGMFELFVAKRFSRRGFILITSSMMDEFAKKPSSRELMMFVGRQLGHIKAGHFRFWFFKNIIGLSALFFYAAWRRRCHITADRIGLLCAGNLYAAEQALIMITVGTGLAAGTNFDAIEEQREKLGESFWGWVRRIFSTYPYMVDRIVLLREYANLLGVRASRAKNGVMVGALPIAHTTLRSVPILLIHGHDRMALLELQNLLYAKFPFVMPRVMVSEQLGSLGMSEKFERITGDLVGAIALVTPDDRASAARDLSSVANRARQNVVMEIGWVWGKLGRQRCLLLKRGDVEMPSDLAGVDVQTFNQTPGECITAVHGFIEHLTASREA